MINQTSKQGWRNVRFGDVVKLNTDRISDPEAEGIERYVGLEHITPEDLIIRDWGYVSEGTTFTNHFKSGQVLFGKRRAYQRKVALADFEGVCSSDIYTFETKDADILLPELLPFLCQSEGFYNFAVNTSAGSLSPRTNWKHLKEYEFALPPMDEQFRILHLLSKSTEVLNQHIILQNKFQRLRESFSWSIFTQTHPMNTNSKLEKFGEIATIIMGQSPPGDSYNAEGKGFPLLNGPTEFGDLHPTANQWTNQITRVCEPGDILFCVRASVGKQNIADQKYCIGRGLAAIRGKQDISTTGYLRIISESIAEAVLQEAKGAGSTFPNITSKRLKEWLIPLPSIDKQLALSKMYNKLIAGQMQHSERMLTLNIIHQKLVEKVFQNNVY